MATAPEITEADIMERVVVPGKGDMNLEAARAMLAFKFDSRMTKQIRALLRKNNRGTISAPERLTLEKFLRVGKLIDILQAKARLSLRHADTRR
jgi:hypothetical protein